MTTTRWEDGLILSWDRTRADGQPEDAAQEAPTEPGGSGPVAECACVEITMDSEGNAHVTWVDAPADPPAVPIQSRRDRVSYL